MNAEWLRSFGFSVLLLSCAMLALPKLGAVLERWLFEPAPTPMLQASVHAPAKPRSAGPSEFAFGHEEAPSSAANAYPVQTTRWETTGERNHPSGSIEILHAWQAALENAGAKLVVVEELPGDLPEGNFQCRCVISATSHSELQKVFAANAFEPSLAMRKVLEQIKAYRNSSTLEAAN